MRRIRPRAAGRLGRSKREGRKRGGEGGGGRKVVELEPMPLIEVAEKMLEMFRQMDGKTAPHSGPKDPEGAMVGIEKFDCRFAYNGKGRKISMPRALLKTGRDFQPGCAYGMPLQRIRPRMNVCKDCGKVQDPRFGFGHGVIMDAVPSSHRDE